jgi:hypothetical protein
MGFEVENKKNFVHFKFEENVSEQDFAEFLKLLTLLVEKGKPFAFIVDTTKAKHIPMKPGIAII